MIDLKARPFYLSDEDIEWVESTLKGMSLEEKIGQLFCPMGFSSDPNVLGHVVNDLHVGGMMYRTGGKQEIHDTYEAIQKMAKIPLLLAANTEAGGNGLLAEGTTFGRPMAVAKSTDVSDPLVQEWKALFEKEGFQVTVRDRSTTIEPENFVGINMTPAKAQLFGELYRPVGQFGADKDLYVYIANMDNASNNTTTRLNWNVVFGLGDDAPWFTEEFPVLFISVANPYHLFDAPMMKTFINSYNSAPDFNQAVMDKILGRSPFKGQSPVDPFCGNEYIRWMNEE